jgi:hypothetical protein
MLLHSLSETKILPLFVILLIVPLLAHAQDMVTSVANDGLERTVSYNVASFTDIRDKKLEDVMSKMPGISENEEGGGYTYNGLTIERMYIDGMDVLEGNYTAIYNMKPEDVERLEITENHVYIKVMRGKQYSNSASINVVLNKKDNDQWFGSLKGGLGLTPLLVNTDLTAIRMGNKWQTTLLFQTDNTGLSLGGAVKGFGDETMDGAWDPDPYSLSGINYSVKSFLDLAPELAPLSLDRVRFNRSGVLNLGTTVHLKNDYQLNFQLLYHTDRLTAFNSTETTYYMAGGETIDYYSTERAKNHQNDIQAEITLLSNTDKHFLRNDLSFSTQWYDTHTEVTGSTPNIMTGKNNPLLVKNNFQYKLPLGDNVLTLSANAGLYSRPQSLNVVKEREGVLRQEISSYSAYGEFKTMLDRRISDHLTFSLDAGLTGNIRHLKAEMKELADYELPNSESRFNAFTAFGGASLTYISDHLQATLGLPIDYAHFSLKDQMNQRETTSKSKFYFSPELSLTYIPFEFLSLNLEGALYDNEHPRYNIYKGLVFSDFRTANEGYSAFNGSRSINTQLTASFSWPKSSLFVNVHLGYWDLKEYFGEVMELNSKYMINKYIDDIGVEQTYDASIDISKGIESFKGMVGIKVSTTLIDTDIERNEITLPFTNHLLAVAPYINGRLNSWWNIVYKLQYMRHNTKMDDGSLNYSYDGYDHSLEMVFSPWRKFNFSILGEHYHTDFSGDLTKDLVLFDLKAEYNLTDNLQLILSAKNILNHKNYNLTTEDTESLSKSFVSYDIRPRNVLLSLYYKF